MKQNEMKRSKYAMLRNEMKRRKTKQNKTKKGKRDVVRTTKYCFIRFNKKNCTICSDFCSGKVSTVGKMFRFVTVCNHHI